MNTDKFTLNGVVYSDEELIHVCEQKMKHADSSEDEFAVYSFIHQWFTDSGPIEVPTSGSTGIPKVMLFNKKQITESAMMTCNYLGIRENMNMLLCLSARYIAGKMMIARAFVSGANLIVVPPSGNPLIDLDDKIDFTAMVPLQVKQAIEDSSTRGKFASISKVIIGGAALPPALEKELAVFPNHIYSTFAMTETLSHIALRRIGKEADGNIYELLPGISITTDERDCMVITAPHLLEKPVITNDVISKVNETHFKWLGRFDNMINSGGIKIYPEKLEEKIAHLFHEHRFYITSLPDDGLGQMVVLVAEGSEVFISEELKREIAVLTDKYETPKKYFIR